MKKIFLDKLPKEYNKKTNKEIIHWSKTVGLSIPFIYNNIKGIIEIMEYNKKGYLTIKYKNILFDISLTSIAGCNLGKVLGIVTNKFKVEIGENLRNNKRNITIINREYREKEHKGKQGRKNIVNEKWYLYHCNKCGYEGWIIENSLIGKIKQGCSCCQGRTVIEGINDIPTTAPWMVKYFQGGYEEAKLYTYGSTKKIFPFCPDCGKIKDTKMIIQNIYLRKSIGCKKCSDNISYPSKIMFNILEQLEIDFKTEYNPKWCKYLYKNKLRKGFYDFYISSMNIIIEIDGAFHIRNNTMSGLTAKESKYIDDEKDRLAKKYNIEVVRIDSKISDLEYIKQNILNSDLSELFDLSIIDWNKCEKYALSNLVKKACKYKMDNPDMTTTEIGKLMKLHLTTIINYLKKGSSVGWCKYDSQEERVKSSTHNGKANGKPVEIFKDGISLGILPSASELGRQSEKLFGVKLLNSKISGVCTGDRKSYKGYSFKYVN